MQVKINERFYPLLFNEDRYLVLLGGSGCFHANQLVVTDEGSKRISEIKLGDKVLSFNHADNTQEYKEVTYLHKFNNPADRLIRIKLRNGKEIVCTENHKFFIGGSYLKIKEFLVSLGHGDMEKNT